MGHSRFAPSATEREYTCPASFLLNEHEPDRQSFDAAHGTAAHHIGQLCLSNNHDTVFYAGCKVAVTATGDCRFVHEKAPLRDDEMEFEVDDEMVNAVQAYIDWCRELPGDHFVEIRVEHTRWCPDVDEWGDPLGPQFGTSDHIACQPRVLVVTDLKYGKGVQVFAFENKQAIKYALGAWLEYDWIYNFEKVVIRIAQPRLDHFDVWELTVEELLAYGEDIKQRLGLVFVENPPFGPSEKGCKFCKVAARCKPLAQHIDSHRALLFDDETQDFIDTKLLTTEDLAAAWKLHPLVNLRYDAIEREISQCLRDNVEVPGLKLVEARTHRQWNDQLVAKKTLVGMGIPKAKVLKEKLISPNQAEKLLPKERREELDGLWYKPPGGPTIVSADDPREAFDGSKVRHEGFSDETDDDGFN